MSSPRVDRPAVPSEQHVAAIRALAARVAAADGREPLSDQALTELRSDTARHMLVWDGDVLTGYGQLDGSSAEIAAETDRVSTVLDVVVEAADGPVSIWTHGRHSRLDPELHRRNAVPERRLHQLRRPLDDALPDADPPAGVVIDTFVVGQDEAGWLSVNAAAFAEHPEQGLWAFTDLAAREAEPWFDPSGFFLARRAGGIIGFHWTKIHPDRAGEVYVIGVDPREQGSGLGAVLLNRGLAHLRSRGCPSVLLYVDESNAGAMRLYKRNGFVPYDLDVQWRLG